MELDPFLEAILDRSDDWPVDANNDSANFTNLDIDFMSRHPVLSYTYLCILGIQSIMGILGNLTVIGSIVVYKPLRTTGNMFIANLALIDLCITAIVDPFIMVGVMRGPIYFYEHSTLCHILAALCVIACMGSLFNVTFVAVNRYIFLCKHHFYGSIFTWRTTFWYCVGLWFIGGLFELPNNVGWGMHVFDLKNMNCFPDRMIHSYIYFMSSGILITLIAVCFCYFKIFMYVRRIRKNLFKISDSSSMTVFKARQQEEIQLAKTFAILCLLYVICYTPFAILVLVDEEDHVSKIVYTFTIEMAHFNNSVNCILYGLMNKRFQKGYLYLFKSIKRCLSSMVPKSKPQDEFASITAVSKPITTETSIHSMEIQCMTDNNEGTLINQQ